MLQIRYAQLSDSEDLGYILAMSWRTSYKGIVPKNILLHRTPAKRTEYFRENIESPSGHRTAVMLLDGKPIGFATFGASREPYSVRSEGEIGGLYLLEKYQRKGFGTELTKWVFSELQNQGFDEILLWVLEENYSARHFYETIGFRNTGIQKEILIGILLTEIRYVRRLGDLYCADT